jgi:phosphotriesterase-related protein
LANQGVVEWPGAPRGSKAKKEQDMKVLRTVTGDVPVEDNGITLTHEHLLYAYPGADLDHRTAFDFEAIVDRVAGDLRSGKEANGIGTVVEMTPVEVYRHPPLMKAASERSGVNVVAVTGFFPQSMGLPYYWRRQTVEELAEFFITDLRVGMMWGGHQTNIKAGAVKIATGGEGVATTPSPVGPDGLRITAIEQRVIRAAARAQRALGCLVNTHTDPNDYAVTNPGTEQLDLLEDEGADPSKVIIGHAFIQNTGMHQLYEILNRGATLNVDHIGIPWKHGSIDELDGILADQIFELVQRGYADRLTFSYDRWFYNPRARVTELDPEFLNAAVPIGYMFDSFIPRLLKMGISDDVVEQILVLNPRRLLAIDA